MSLRHKTLAALIISFIFSYLPLNLNASSGEEGKEFNPSEAIIEHVTDAHEWHIATIGENHISIPLPVILIDEGKFVTFSSSHFHHGEESYMGYALAEAGENQGKIVKVDSQGKEIEGALPLDFSITKNVLALFISAFLLLLIFTIVARGYKKRPNSAPKGLQAVIEPIIAFIISDVAIPNIGEKKYSRFLPYLLTVFFFIFINNIMGLIPIFPGGANLTGNIAVTMTLAVMTLLVVNFSGNRGYWKHIFFAPGVPFWLLPIMIPVELIGILSKPFALMVRLFANITAGHIIVLSLVSLIFIFQSLAIAPVSVLFVLFMDVLELLVAVLQAYIFTLLSALFIGMAVAEPEHH